MHFVHDSCCMILFLSVKSLQEFFFLKSPTSPSKVKWPTFYKKACTVSRYCLLSSQKDLHITASSKVLLLFYKTLRTDLFYYLDSLVFVQSFRRQCLPQCYYLCISFPFLFPEAVNK